MSKAANIIFVEIKDAIFRRYNSGESVFFSSANTLNGGKTMNHAIREKILALDPTDIRVEYR